MKIANEPKGKLKSVTTSLPPDLLNALREIAVEDDISLSHVMRRCLKQCAAEHRRIKLVAREERP